MMLSGCGWLIDTGVFLSLVNASTLSVMMANIAGGICGATFSFLTSSYLVFSTQGRRNQAANLLIYLIYTALLIVCGSAAIALVNDGLESTTMALGMSIRKELTAFIAKCIVTPALLAANYLTAKYLNEH